MIKTENTEWGFYGTLKQNSGLSDRTAAGLFAIEAEILMTAEGLTAEQAREYLDSTHGRHLADALGFLPQAEIAIAERDNPEWLRDLIQDLNPTWLTRSVARAMRRNR